MRRYPPCPLCGGAVYPDDDTARTVRLACWTGHWDQYVWADTLEPVAPLPWTTIPLERRRDATAADRERARQLRAQGLSERQIAARLGWSVWAISTWLHGRRGDDSRQEGGERQREKDAAPMLSLHRGQERR